MLVVDDNILVVLLRRCLGSLVCRVALSSLKDADRQPLDECVRRVERGSRIVGVVPLDTKLVLQVCAENVEPIHSDDLSGDAEVGYAVAPGHCTPPCFLVGYFLLVTSLSVSHDG